MSNRSGRAKNIDKLTQPSSAGTGASKLTMDTASSDSELTQTLKELREGIKMDLVALKEEILAELRSTVSNLQVSVSAHGEKIADIETSLTDVDGRVITLEQSFAVLQAENTKLHGKLDVLENFSRRNNIRVTGLEEKIEGNRPSAFMEELLTEIFGKDSFVRPPVVDRAHRTLRPPSATGPPRAMVVRMHYYQAKEQILRMSWEKGQLNYRGAKISFYPDLSTDLVRRRATFLPVKKLLREAGVEYSLLHPAKLRFLHNGTKHVFDSPTEATTFVKAKILPEARKDTFQND